MALRSPSPSQTARATRSARAMINDIAADPSASGRGRRVRLVEALLRSGYLPTTIDADRSHVVAQMSAPVFNGRGDVALVVMGNPGPPYELRSPRSRRSRPTCAGPRPR